MNTGTSATASLPAQTRFITVSHDAPRPAVDIDRLLAHRAHQRARPCLGGETATDSRSVASMLRATSSCHLDHSPHHCSLAISS
jgi:hypothetical protein